MASHIKRGLQIEEVALASLHPDPLNSRRIGETELEALTRSLAEFGFVDPLIVRKEDLRVIGGHARLQAARRLGYEAVPVVLIDLSEEQARLLGVALNKIGGDFDDELLGHLLAEISQAPDVDLSLTGFADDEISGLLKGLETREKRSRIESFDLEAALQAARSAARAQPGELWILGDHRLLVGDACDAEVVGHLLSDRRPAMGFSDPPYGVSLGNHGGQQAGQRRRPLQNDSLPPDQWEAFLRLWAPILLSSVDGAIYICMSSSAWPLVSQILAESGGHWSDTLIWSKDRFVLGRSDYQRQYEVLWYGWREGTSHVWNGGRDQGDVWHIKRPSQSPLAPTMKPLELIGRAIENSSQPGDLVLDLFLGSGSTLIACERAGRLCFATEIDPHYASVAIARWEAFSGLKARKIDA